MKIKELLDSPEKWTKGEYARDKDDKQTYLENEGATCWCLLGAIYKCYGFDEAHTSIYNKVYEKIICTPTIWNDAPERTFDDVKKLVGELDI